MSPLDQIDALSISEICGTTCPACGAETRGRNDGRPAVKWATPRNWICAACSRGGGPVQWLGWSVLGRKPSGADWRDLVQAAETRGWLSGEASYAPVAPLERREAPPVFPPAEEVRALWGRCEPVCGAVWDWLVSRGIDARLVRRWDLARCLPRGELPGWAESWRAGWWCVVPAYDDRGELVTFRARWVRREAPTSGAKARPPKGFDARGSVLLGPAALEAEGDVLVVEGEPAYLYAVSRVSCPVIGVFAGAGTPALWRGIRGRVFLATDADEPGDKYAEKISRWCRQPVRVRPPSGMGFDDACKDGWGDMVIPWR